MLDQYQKHYRCSRSKPTWFLWWPQVSFSLESMPCLDHSITGNPGRLILQTHLWASLIAQLVKNLPSVWETPVQFLGRQDLLGYPLQYSWASLVAQVVKNPPVMQETWVQSLGWEDPLERGKTTHSSILARRIPWTAYVVHGVTKSRTQLSDFPFHFSGSHPVWVEVIYQGDCHQIENGLLIQGNPLTPDIFQCPHKSLPISSDFLGSCIFEARK